MAEIMSNPQVLARLLQMPYGTEVAWRQRIEEMPTWPTTAELFIVAERGGRVVGSAGVHPVAHVRRRHAEGIGMAAARVAQRQGVGSALMAAFIDWADNWAQLLRLKLTVYSDNEGGLAPYRKFGFVAEPTHNAFAMRDARCAMRDGAYVGCGEHGAVASEPAAVGLRRQSLTCVAEPPTLLDV